MEIFRAENVVKRYADHLALDNVSVTIPQGKIYGLLGPNGAGKTTLIRIINQITMPDSGKIYFKGNEMKMSDVQFIGYLPEERGLYKKMKVGEQAMYFAQLKGLSHSEALKRLRYWFAKFEIQAWWNKKVEELSKGMAQKVQFIITILHEPELMIFDEPFSGFDPINANLLKEEILEFKKKGHTIIFSTHNMASVEELCDNITLINKSRNVLSGDIDEIRHSYGDNIYQIDYVGEVGALSKVLHNGYQIVDEVFEKGLSKVRVKLQPDQSGNPLISAVVPHVEVVNFQKIIPSMNDIFIKVVQGESSLKAAHYTE
ncbi:ABC transporter ATP-binding protein [Acetobacteroides hydrogenigenes]|uniref:ABC-2 type transport system ATP-binding protein n=1 Tax=Acetobacteroides hydrogenigenes TaxID=979970 RepID=A0A4R2EUX6_9BACT|nr:ATP-binding cassette domain-containing protein [Acetobacteroides hydrogenigenes]TCN73119.1 ABC-2 type transport system ATP-binding protein [Acetobacteroides hydrogenigenes]